MSKPTTKADEGPFLTLRVLLCIWVISEEVIRISFEPYRRIDQPTEIRTPLDYYFGIRNEEPQETESPNNE